MASQERSPLDRDYAKWERILAHEEVVQNRSESVANREYTPSGEALWLPYIESRQESSELTKNLTAKESHPKEIWQIVVKPLRVWAAASRPAPSGEVLPCRPRFMFVGNLYPTGKLLYRRACDPPEEQPSTFFVLDAIKQLILTPPEDQPQHRPGKIVFSDKDLAVKLHTSLERIGIDCGYLSEADAFDDYARAISKHLLEKEMADVSPSNNKPGLLSVSHVTEELFKRFWNATQEFYALSPWKFTKERQCFRIRVPEEGHPLPYVKTKPGNLWVGVLGYSSTVDDDPDPESEESNNNDDDDDEETTVAKKRQGVRGLCMFYNRWDAEQRMMSSVDPDLPEKQIAHALPHPSDLHCQRSECGAATGDLKRCSRCKEVYYCSRECQQQDWNRHAKTECFNSAQTRQKGEPFWGLKEISLMFEDCTSLPFEDIEAAEKLGLVVKGDDSYPLPLIFENGADKRPTAHDLVWFLRALNAVQEWCRSRKSDVECFYPTQECVETPLNGAYTDAEVHLENDIRSAQVLLDPMMTKDEKEAMEYYLGQGKANSNSSS